MKKFKGRKKLQKSFKWKDKLIIKNKLLIIQNEFKKFN